LMRIFRAGKIKYFVFLLLVLSIQGCKSSSPQADVQPPEIEPSISLPSQISPRPGPPILYASYPSAPQLENSGIWKAQPILISGATAYRSGEFLYQDWLLDDRGAAGTPDFNDPHGVGSTGYLFSRKAGTLTYPTNPVYANNAADLVELRVRSLDQVTAFRITLNTMIEPERAAFTLALGGSDALVDWPLGSAVRSPAAIFVTVHGEQPVVHEANNPIPLSSDISVSVDQERRQIEVLIPHDLWNPGDGKVRLAAGVGLWDIESSQYLQPGLLANETAPGGAALSGAALFNVAFRSEPMPEFTAKSGRTIADAAAQALVEARFWRERSQADALASGDISKFHAIVDFAKLQKRVNDESGVPSTGHMNRIFASRFVFGQGIDYSRECGLGTSGECDGPLVGQLQPYAIYVPRNSPPQDGYGLTLLLHALSANFNQYLGSRHAEQLGERGPGSIVITPAARGPDGFYIDMAEADVFEVWADVARYYPLNPDWVAMSGISMGGIGSFRLASRYPDLFARIAPVVATNPVEYLTVNMHNVPVMMWVSALDELQPLPQTELTVQALDGVGLRYDVLSFPTWDHLSPSTYDYYPQANEFLGEYRVERNPSRVRYIVDLEQDSPRAGVVAPRGAYWVSQIRLNNEDLSIGAVDIITEGLGAKQGEPEAVNSSTGVLSGGNHEPAPYARRQREWSSSAPIPRTDRLHIKAENVKYLQIDPVRAGLSCFPDIRIDADSPVEVKLTGC
jgi:pimeloyl-ACP methyl ester carboxylesterase